MGTRLQDKRTARTFSKKYERKREEKSRALQSS